MRGGGDLRCERQTWLHVPTALLAGHEDKSSVVSEPVSPSLARGTVRKVVTILFLYNALSYGLLRL